MATTKTVHRTKRAAKPKTTKSKADQKANGAAKAETPPQAPFEPLLTLNCGQFGIWGLSLTSRGLVAAYVQTPGGWAQQPAIPPKLARFIDPFMDVHEGACSRAGFYTSSMRQAELMQLAAQGGAPAQPPQA